MLKLTDAGMHAFGCDDDSLGEFNTWEDLVKLALEMAKIRLSECIAEFTSYADGDSLAHWWLGEAGNDNMPDYEYDNASSIYFQYPTLDHVHDALLADRFYDTAEEIE